MSTLDKIIIILGPTASGKTKLAVSLAREFDGEIISADSRQVYEEMNIGTGKDLAEYQNVPYHLINIKKPNEEFNVAEFKGLAVGVARNILSRGKLPIICGGTGLYLSAIIDNYDFSTDESNTEIRRRVEGMSSEEKIKTLEEIDPESIEMIDIKNPRRLNRAVEVVLAGQKFSDKQTKSSPLFDTLQIGIDAERDKLKEKINKRVDEMFKNGLVEETQGIIKKYGKECAVLETIGYSEVMDYLDGKVKIEETKELIKTHTHQFAKRQMTWFKRDKRIRWISDKDEAKELVKDFNKKELRDMK